MMFQAAQQEGNLEFKPGIPKSQKFPNLSLNLH